MSISTLRLGLNSTRLRCTRNLEKCNIIYIFSMDDVRLGLVPTFIMNVLLKMRLQNQCKWQCSLMIWTVTWNPCAVHIIWCQTSVGSSLLNFNQQLCRDNWGVLWGKGLTFCLIIIYCSKHLFCFYCLIIDECVRVNSYLSERFSIALIVVWYRNSLV